MTTIEKDDGTYTTDTQTTLMHMLTHFVPDDRTDSDNHHHKKVRKDCQAPTTTADDKPFTQEEIMANLKKFNSKKTPGEDGLTSDILIRAFQIFPLVFTQLYNVCLQKGCFPKRWKCSTIVPIIKPGKENCNDASKYRPISLLNTGGKLLERLLIDRILYYMHSNNLFNNNQYGFTPQRGTEDAAMVAKNFIEESLRLKQCTVVVSLDVKGAFDAAWWPSILKQLKEFECPANLYKLSASYFSNRRAKLIINNYTMEKEVQKGCPQGSCCAPGYWNILYNSLLNLKFSSQTKVIAFADDLMVLTRGISAIEAENYANQDLKKIERWATDNKMEFNDKKSQVLFISRKRNDEKSVSIYLNYKKLDQTNELKYLGIYLDSKFNFNAHIDYTTDKLIKLINMLARTAKLQWGLGHKALKTIYEGAVIPILTYGAPVWIEAIRKRRNLAKYKRIQRLMNIKIAKAYRTISYEASCVIAGEPPIEILLGQKVQTYVNTKVNNSDYDAPLEVRHWRHPAELVTIREAKNGTLYTTEVYTDGSKTGDKVGAAGVVFENGKMVHQMQFKLHGHCTNNQAEQIAILKTLEKLEELQAGQNGIYDKHVALYTDSKITLDLLQNPFKRNRLIEFIRNKITDLENLRCFMHFGWIKGHTGIEGNEIVDKLAKEAALKEGPIAYAKIPREVITTREKEYGLNMWQKQWKNTGKGAVTKTFFPSVRSRLQTKIPGFPEFTTMMTGHGKIRTYLHRFGFTNNPKCPCDDKEDQTIQHLIVQCTKLTAQRNELIKHIKQTGGTWPMANAKLISEYLPIFVKFIKTIDFTDL